MNFLRTLFWKIASKKIYKITFPTKSLYEQFKVLKIFDEKKKCISSMIQLLIIMK